jgi:hypothetical protein
MHTSYGFLPLSSFALLLLAACGGQGETQTASGGPGDGPLQDTEVEEARAQAQRDLILGQGSGTEYGTLGREAFETEASPAGKISPDVGSTWSELAALPAVTTAYGFALAVSDVDSKAHLGFMFTDATYEATLESQGVLWIGDGAYTGSNAVALYGLTGTGASRVWTAYQGRLTPQTYQFSELRYDSGNSFYTTLYPSFGGLISVIENGGKGVWALTPLYTTERAHSVAFNSHVLYALATQQSIGLTLSTTPISSFGNLSDLWTNLATIETAASSPSLPELIDAGGTLVGAYIGGTGTTATATIRATTSPSTVTTASAFTSIGSCASATQVDVAYTSPYLYVACVTSTGTLSVQRANISSLSSIAWSAVATPGVTTAVSAIDLAGQGSVISLAVRQGTALKVFTSVSDPTPSFNMAIPGTFALQPAAEGLVLSVSNLSATTNQIRTFLK